MCAYNAFCNFVSVQWKEVCKQQPTQEIKATILKDCQSPVILITPIGLKCHTTKKV